MSFTMNWKTALEQAPNIWLYIRTHDNNFAFHVRDGLLSLACCKGNNIRRKSIVDDVVVVMTSIANKQPLRLSGIFCIDERVGRQTYYKRFAGDYSGLDARDFKTGRLDNIYNNGCLLINSYHGPDDYAGGVLKDMKSDNVLLSQRFSCFGNGTRTAPGILVPEHLTTIPRGFRGVRMLKENHQFNPENYAHGDDFLAFLSKAAVSGAEEVRTPRPRDNSGWTKWNWKKAARIVEEARLGKPETSVSSSGTKSKRCGCMISFAGQQQQ